MEWKRVVGHPNYEVSREGQVRNRHTQRVLTRYNHGTPHVTVSLAGGGSTHLYIPYLVDMHFGRSA